MLTRLNKYIPISQANWLGIVELKIIDDGTQLKCCMLIHQVRQSALFANVSAALELNPGNKALADTLDKELMMNLEFTQLSAINIKTGTEESLRTYLQTQVNPLGTDVIINCIPGLNNFKLPYNKAYVFYNFIAFFTDNYEAIKLSLVTDTTDIIDEKAKDLEVDGGEIDESKIVKHGLFYEMMNCVDCPNVMRVFLAKQILIRDFAVSITSNTEKQELTILHKPLYDFNVWGYSSIHSHELLTLLSSIEEKDLIHISSKLRALTRQLFYLSNREVSESEQIEYDVTITCLLCMVYLYSLKIVEYKYLEKLKYNNVNVGENYLSTVNTGLKYVVDKFGLNGNVRVIRVGWMEETTSSVNLETKVQDIMAQYQYLNNIDAVSFRNAVFGDLMKEDETHKPINFDPSASLNRSHIVNIDSYKDSPITPTVQQIFDHDETSSMLRYADINIELFKDRTIISKPLAQVLLLQFDGSNRMYVKDSNPLRLYFDNIINHILPSIDKQKFLAENITSFFQIYEHFIAPFIMNKAITTKEIQFLMFQVIVPYLYDTVGLRRIIDNFH